MNDLSLHSGWNTILYIGGLLYISVYIYKHPGQYYLGLGTFQPRHAVFIDKSVVEAAVRSWAEAGSGQNWWPMFDFFSS